MKFTYGFPLNACNGVGTQQTKSDLLPVLNIVLATQILIFIHHLANI